MEIELQILEYVISHLFLPPQLPQKDDWDSSSHTKIIQFVLKSIDRFMSQITDNDTLSVWNALRRMVQHMADTRTEESLNEHTLKKVMLDMQPNGAIKNCYLKSHKLMETFCS